jgi:integrase
MRPTGHIRERSPGKFEIRYSLGVEPSGKRKVATATVRGSRKDAERELRRLLRARDEGAHVDPHRMTVGQWLDRWIGYQGNKVAPKTKERYVEIIENFLKPAFGAIPLMKLNALQIEEAHKAWTIGGRRDGKTGGLSPRTRKHLHRIARGAFRAAINMQLIARNPFDLVTPPKVEAKKMMTLDVDQAARLLESLGHSKTYWPTMLALATGMRRGEILALRWSRVDFNRATLHVAESLEQTKDGIRFKKPKSGKDRTVALPRFAIEELKRLKVQQAEELLGIGVRQTGETLVVARYDGEPLQPQSLTHEFTRLVARAKDLPRVRFHDLRHSHATQLLQAGVHPKIAQVRLGHSSVAITMDLYSHATDSMQADAADKIDAALGFAVNGVGQRVPR